jgi:hypothetical protein
LVIEVSKSLSTTSSEKYKTASEAAFSYIADTGEYSITIRISHAAKYNNTAAKADKKKEKKTSCLFKGNVNMEYIPFPLV